jgi:excisionase family DNA binding protein
MLGTREIGRQLGLTRRTIERWCRTGRLPGVQVGRLWRVPADALEDLTRRRTAARPPGPLTG